MSERSAKAVRLTPMQSRSLERRLNSNHRKATEFGRVCPHRRVVETLIEDAFEEDCDIAPYLDAAGHDEEVQ